MIPELLIGAIAVGLFLHGVFGFTAAEIAMVYVFAVIFVVGQRALNRLERRKR